MISKLKLLIVTPYIPYPLSEGGKISQFAVIDYLRRYQEITLAVVAYSSVDCEYAHTLKSLWPDVHIEIIDLVEKKEKPSFLRRKMKRIDYEVRKVFGLQKENAENDIYDEFNNSFLHHTPYTKSRSLIEQLYSIVLKNEFDLVQIELIDFIDLVYALPENIKKVFVHHEIKFSRLRSSLSGRRPSQFENYILRYVKASELVYLNQYDKIFVFSEDDKQKLENESANLHKKIEVTPFPVLDKYFLPLTDKNSSLKKIVFIGGESHAPNKDAVNWYLNEIAPVVQSSNNMPLYVIGNWNEATIQVYKKYDNTYFTGYIDDIISFCEDSIMIVPVRIGSGIRTKILYAMAQGVPVVSTSIGCEGINVKDRESIMIANSPEEFNIAIAELINNKELRNRVTDEAQKIVKSAYSQEAVASLRSKLYSKMLHLLI
jgi:glycosyltransferase involved in cell wall biosynthesis